MSGARWVVWKRAEDVLEGERIPWPGSDWGRTPVVLTAAPEHQPNGLVAAIDRAAAALWDATAEGYGTPAYMRIPFERIPRMLQDSLRHKVRVALAAAEERDA